MSLSIEQSLSNFSIHQNNNLDPNTPSVFKAISQYFPTDSKSSHSINKIIYDYYNSSQYQLLANTINSILYQLPPGKPDPQEYCSPETLIRDERARIYQPAYKYNTCWYYSLNTIRCRIGKNASKELAAERRIEQICSQRRKKISAHQSSLPTVFNLLETEDSRDLFSRTDKDKAFGMIQDWEEIYKDFLETDEALKGNSPSFYPFLIDFTQQRQYDDLYSYLKSRKLLSRAQINKKFFKKMNRSPSTLFGTAQRLDPVQYKKIFNNFSWKDLPDMIRHALLDRYAMHISAELYGLKISSWSPFQSIDALITELKKQGPLAVGGCFGPHCYTTKPFKMKQQIGGRDIFAWEPGARKPNINNAGHAITLVGGKKVDNKGFVYYIDPADPSDPACVATQKIYLISYKSLQENIFNLYAAWGPDTSHSPAGYAWISNNFSIKNCITKS